MTQDHSGEVTFVDLATIIDKAKHRGAVLAQPGRLVVRIQLNGAPSHQMSNAVAACQGELEDLFLRRMDILSGGAGCLVVEFDLGEASAADESRIRAFLSNADNLAYFLRRYGVNEMSLKRTPRYF